MRRRAVLLLITVMTAVLVITSGMALPQTSPQGTLDANCQVGPASSYGYISSLATAQTFTAIRSGKLTGAQVGIMNLWSSSNDIVMEIRSVDSSGTPTSSVLASVTIPASTIPTTTGWDTTTITGNFGLGSAPSVVAGQKYALTLRLASSGGIAYGLPVVAADPCPGGNLYDERNGGWSTHPNNHDIASFSIYVTAPPANDNFASAQMINGSTASINGANLLATPETGEPSTFQESPTVTSRVASAGHSVWYRWTAPTSGSTTIDTCTTDYDSVLGVYTGNFLNSLTEVASNNNNCASGWGSKVTFDAQAGTTYQIEIDGTGGLPQGTFTLKLYPTDTIAPKVDSVTKPQTRSGNVEVQFSESMEPLSLMNIAADPVNQPSTSETIKLYKGTVETPAKVRCKDTLCKTVVLDPDKRLAKGTKYTVKIEGVTNSDGVADNDGLAVEDLADNELAQDFVSSFKTRRR